MNYEQQETHSNTKERVYVSMMFVSRRLTGTRAVNDFINPRKPLFDSDEGIVSEKQSHVSFKL